ncbi:MAG: hypothetical protein IAE97_06550 [Chthoniobacterales bacterium]|nr:hypothetical protein [Chthoniobacterales bacterium]
MKPKDIFSLAVRLLGLFFLYLAVRAVAVILSGPPSQIATGGILGVALFVAVGWWMLGGASLLMDRAYPSESGQQRNPEASGGLSANVDN